MDRKQVANEGYLKRQKDTEDMSEKLNPEKVEQIFRDCLFKEEEIPITCIMVEGIRGKFGLHPGRVNEHREEIAEMLNELPFSFHEGKGEGMSFMEACQDKNGEQWTGLHEIMDLLFVLGMAVGKASYLMPREAWSMLPGGMPYIVIHTEFKEVKEVPAPQPT